MLMFPPPSCWKAAPMLPTTLRERTVMPLTRPMFRATRNPSMPKAVVTLVWSRPEAWGCSMSCLLSLAQLDPADLAADRLRQLADELDLPGVLVRRGDRLHVLLEVRRQLVGGIVSGRQHDERLDDRSAHGIALGDHGCLRAGGVLDQRALDLEGPDPVAGGDDHVVGAADEPERAVTVDVGAVAGHVPVAPLADLGRRGFAPVLSEQPDGPLGLKPHGDVALRVGAQRLPFLVDHRNSHAGRRLAHR